MINREKARQSLIGYIEDVTKALLSRPHAYPPDTLASLLIQATNCYSLEAELPFVDLNNVAKLVSKNKPRRTMLDEMRISEEHEAKRDLIDEVTAPYLYINNLPDSK